MPTPTLGELTLGYPWPGELTLGRTTDPGIPDNELAITITLPAPIANVQFLQGVRHRLAWSVPWSAGDPQAHSVSGVHTTATPLSSRSTGRWSTGERADAGISSTWRAGQATEAPRSMRWTSPLAVDVARSIRWGVGFSIDASRILRWSGATLLAHAVRVRGSSGRLADASLQARWGAGSVRDRSLSVAGVNAVILLSDRRLVWKNGIPPPHGWRRVVVYGGGQLRRVGELNLVCPWPGELTLGRPCFGSARFLVPIQRRYRVLNEMLLIRVSDEADLACSNITVQLSLDDWCWTLSATLLARPAYDTVPAYPGLVRATLNGFAWDFIVDDLRYRRILGDFAPTLTGRSPIAALAAPYASSKDYREGSLHTAAQLALQELPVGWTLDWQIPDWTVAAGIWQYQGLTPMEAIIRVIKAAGGRIQPDPQDRVITAVPKWPQKPWAWTGWLPDASLPVDYTLEESLQPVTGAEYEGILVSGGANGGLAALIQRTGTAGAWVAPAVVDTLITDSAPAEARGIQALADAWPMKRYTLDLPLQAAPAGAGLILPGTTFDFVDGSEGWRGLVISTSITASFNSIIQTLEVVSP
ncbi:MAG: hypothetical protein H6974_09350 [Gammaproteobacteria bacterium]|nr:hypothetical protein [Gammaproteobacteria bacterium]